ncbi:hypothetical protein BGX26_007223 [Mortierella sp. AD094]|nr:hypothetical protein BGX26_007223 [Mortierella sp. AD094]
MSSPLFQVFRPVYNVSTPTNPLPLPDAVKIEANYDIKIKENIILWSDICTVFKNPLFVRNDGALVPFLKDENFEPCKPLRILARPNIALEVVMEAPLDLLRLGVTNTPLLASTTIDSQTHGTSSALQHNIGGSTIAVAPVQNLIDQPPQYAREDSSTGSIASGSIASGSTATSSIASGSGTSGSGTSSSSTSSSSTSGSSTSSTNRSTAATNSNTNIREVGILRNTTGQGSDDYEQGLAFYFGKGVQVDYTLAKAWFSQAADLGHVAAQYYLAYMLENGQGSTQNVAAAVSSYIETGFRGYDIDQRNAGVVRGNIQGKLAKALHWYSEAGHRGDTKAQCVMGFLHQHGKGAQKHYGIARGWYTEAVNHGNDNAQNNLGVIHYNGNCGVKNYSKAFELFTKASLQGHARAQFNLGSLYEHGLGVPEDWSKAAEWYTKSANQGYSKAQHSLGSMCLDGNGVQQNISRAFELIRKAANQGDDVGQFKLGNMYYYGEGVNRITSVAQEWWRKSAGQGNTEAQYNLANLH